MLSKNNYIAVLSLAATFIIVFVSGCNQSNGSVVDQNVSSPEKKIDYRETQLKPIDFMSWFKNDAIHLRKIQDENGMQFTMQFRPLIYLATEQIQKEEITKAELDSVMNEFKGLMQFKMEIEIPGKNEEFIKSDKPDAFTYEERIKYYAFEMQKDISLIDGGDTIPCAMFHFERSYGVSPKSVFLIGFEKADSDNDLTILVNEKIFSKKNIKFIFSKEDLKNLPQIKTL